MMEAEPGGVRTFVAAFPRVIDNLDLPKFR